MTGRFSKAATKGPLFWTRRIMAPKVVETVEFDADIHPSRLGRLVKVRHRDEEGTLSAWSHGVCTWAETQWIEEEVPGGIRKVEIPTGGYQLQWGLFETVEMALQQKRSRQRVRPSCRTPVPIPPAEFP